MAPLVCTPHLHAVLQVHQHVRVLHQGSQPYSSAVGNPPC